MDILVGSLEWALRYAPKNSTYAIRTLSSFSGVSELKSSRLYSHINEYLIEDYDPHIKQGNPPELAVIDSLLHDFAKNGRNCQSLLVHCRLGVSRSPAIAIALNEIFKLGKDSDKLKASFPGLNAYVYHSLLERATVLGYTS